MNCRGTSSRTPEAAAAYKSRLYQDPSNIQLSNSPLVQFILTEGPWPRVFMASLSRPLGPWRAVESAPEWDCGGVALWGARIFGGLRRKRAYGCLREAFHYETMSMSGVSWLKPLAWDLLRVWPGLDTNQVVEALSAARTRAVIPNSSISSAPTQHVAQSPAAPSPNKAHKAQKHSWEAFEAQSPYQA